MKKIITAIGNEILNKKLKKENEDADIYLELSENINKFIRGE